MAVVDFALDPLNPPRGPEESPPALDDATITEAARTDPDNPPLNADELARISVARRVKAIRTGLGLSQETFAGRYGIPVATLRQWEMARRLPDRASLSYLRVIASMPAQVAAALTVA